MEWLHFTCNVFVGFIVYRTAAAAAAGVNCIALVWVRPEVARTLPGRSQVYLSLSDELEIACETRKHGL